MSIRITRLHIYLFFTAFLLTGLLYLKKDSTFSIQSIWFDIQRLLVKQDTTLVEQPTPVQQAAPIDYKKKARKTIAIAGEEMKIARKKGFAIAEGRALLKQAKVLYAEDSFARADTLGYEAFKQFRNGEKKLLMTYTVRRGDTLWTISKRSDVYGKGAGWVRIWRANEKTIPDFDLLRTGQHITIPRNK